MALRKGHCLMSTVAYRQKSLNMFLLEDVNFNPTFTVVSHGFNSVLTHFEICSFKIIYTMHRCKLPKPTKIGYLDTQSSKRKFCAWLTRINWWSFFLRFITVMWQTWNQHSANFGLGKVFQLIVSTLGKREQVETLQTKRTIRRAIRNNIHRNIQYFSPCQVKIKMVSVIFSFTSTALIFIGSPCFIFSKKGYKARVKSF